MKKDVYIELSQEYFDNLEIVAKDNDVSSYSVFLTCLCIFLFKYTAKSELNIDVFTNDTPLNIIVEKNEYFEAFLKSVHKASTKLTRE